MGKLFRSQTDRMLTGLCGGIAEWSGISSTWIRLLVVVSALFSFGTVVLIYFAVSLFVQKAPYDDFWASSHSSHYHYSKEERY